MARTVKPHEREAKRRDILDAAHRLVTTKGYERMTIQDILAQLEISSGAFYHYFRSKPEVLEALVERIREDTGAPLLRIVGDPTRSAGEKLRAYFDTLDQIRLARQATVIALLQVWYTDANAVVRQKVETATTVWRAPLISEIARQGVSEGLFSTPFPDRAGEIVLALTNGMAAAHARLMLAFMDTRGTSDTRDERRFIDEALGLHAAFLDAVERVLGAPSGTLRRGDRATARLWVKAMKTRSSL
jgi:AcrR family transcriptional regulator